MIRRKPRPEFPITVEHEGKSYTGKYWVVNKIVCVRASGPDGTLPETCTPSSGAPTEPLARTLLREMVETGLVTPDET